MSRFFRRAIDAYRILTGKDDTVQKGIQKLEKEIAEREARHAAQQARLEEQILGELRQSANALKTLKDGYTAQEEVMSKLISAIGENAQAQLAAQAEAEAQMLLDAARRSGLQIKAPPPFAKIGSQGFAASGLESSTLPGSQGEERSLKLESETTARGTEESTLHKDAENVGQGADKGVNRAVDHSTADEVVLNAKLAHEATQGKQVTDGIDEKEADAINPGVKQIPVSAPEISGDSKGEIHDEGCPSKPEALSGGKAGTTGEDTQVTSADMSREQSRAEGQEPEAVKPWVEAVRHDEVPEGSDELRKQIATFVDLPTENATVVDAPGRSSAGGSVSTLEGTTNKTLNSPLPPLQSEAGPSSKNAEQPSMDRPAMAGQKRGSKKVDARKEHTLGEVKAKKKRAPAKKKAES